MRKEVYAMMEEKMFLIWNARSVHILRRTAWVITLILALSL